MDPFGKGEASRRPFHVLASQLLGQRDEPDLLHSRRPGTAHFRQLLPALSLRTESLPALQAQANCQPG